MKKKINLSSLFISVIIISTIFIEFYFSIDLSSGGASGDFFTTYPLVENLTNYNLEPWEYTRHFPLHYFILSIILKIFDNQSMVRLVYIFLSMLIPLFAYYNLKKIYSNIDKNKLLLFASLILLLPFLRASIVWANAHSTGLLFFLISTYFFLTFLEKNKILLMITSIFFLALAVYAVQYYAVFFAIFLYKVYTKYGSRTLSIFFSICVLSSIPGFYFLTIMPRTSEIPFSSNIFNNFLINLSIIFFFLCSFINYESIKILQSNYIKNKKNLILIIISILSVSFAIFFFNPEYHVGGGFIYKLSNIFTKSNFLFYLSSFGGLLFLFFLNIGNTKNYFEIFLVFLSFFFMTSSHMIFQKYFEPTFILTCLFFLKIPFFKTIFHSYKNLSYIFCFYLIYLISAHFYVQFIY